MARTRKQYWPAMNTIAIRPAREIFHFQWWGVFDLFVAYIFSLERACPCGESA